MYSTDSDGNVRNVSNIDKWANIKEWIYQLIFYFIFFLQNKKIILIYIFIYIKYND